MVSKALLLLVAIVAARFGGSTRRTTLALACDESLAAVATTTQRLNNRYSSYYSNNNNNNNYNNNNEQSSGDGIADNKDNNVDDDNNDNYNYNKASAKWQLPQQKLYGNPQSIQQQQQQQQHQRQQQQQLERHQQQQQFVDDSEAAGNDFLLQLPDLNAAVQGADWFPAQDTSNNNNNNNNNDHNDYDYDYNVWHATSESEREHLPLQRSSRSSYKQRQAAGNGAADILAGGQLNADADGIDFEGEEDFAVAKMDADELSEQLPYGIQNVRKRRVRSVMPPPQSQPQYGSTTTSGSEGVTYQSLCPTKRVTIKLDNGEYRPNHYVEVTCANTYAPLPPRLQNYDNYNYRSNELPLLRALLNERTGEKREICSATGFACIQLNRTIHLIRLNEGSGCWESETRTVPSGCECMWPKHSYGDIASYHQAQKRFSNQRARSGPIIDYTPGVGYRQLTLRSRAPKSGAGAVAAGTRSRRADFDYDNY